MNDRTHRFLIVFAMLCSVFSASSMAGESSGAPMGTFAAGDEQSTPSADVKLGTTGFTPLPVPSASVVFSGKLFYWISNANKLATITATQIVNYSGNFTSGSLSLRLFVTPARITGAFAYLTVGEQALNPLRPEYAYSNLSTIVALNTVPDGTYYMHLGIFEYGAACTGSSDGYCLDDYVTFPSRIRVVGGIYVVTGAAESVTAAE